MVADHSLFPFARARRRVPSVAAWLGAAAILSATGHTMAEVFEGHCTQFESQSPRLGGGRLERQIRSLTGDLDQQNVFIRLNDEPEITCLYVGTASPYHPSGHWRCGEFYYNILGYESEQGVYDRKGELWKYTISRSNLQQTCEISADGSAMDKEVVEIWFQEKYNNKSLYVRREDLKPYRLVTPSF